MAEVQEIWTEKYRPKRLSDVIGQGHVTERLAAFAQTRSLPHCLFAGPAGCGKTTASLAIANELYGSGWKSSFLELNASDERGIDTVRVKVKDFARTMPMSGTFKLIYLDEADSLTRDAQHALRRTMEKYAAIARFILSCNYSSRIIEPVQSRCAVFRFAPLKEADVAAVLRRVAESEKLELGSDALDAIVHVAEGDMRKAINVLQSAAVLGGAVTQETIYATTSRADPKAVKKMLTLATDGKFKDARKALLALLYEHGLSGEDIIKEIHAQIFDMDIPDAAKYALIEKAGEYEFRIAEGANPRIQLEALLAQFGTVGK